MGYGDQLMATGMARGARDRGRRIAFGDRRLIRWDSRSAEVFGGNPNIAPPGAERDQDIEWLGYYKGQRLYNSHDRAKNRWIWNMDFRPIPGEVFFDQNEKRNGRRAGSGFVVIEPHVEAHKSSGPNKDWGFDNYQEVATRLIADGHKVIQFKSKTIRQTLDGVPRLPTLSFRDALAILSHAALYIGPEGGLHHGAAAVDTQAVVIFGGFIPPQVTGYHDHANLTGGAEACGSLSPCEHCKKAMRSISVDEVYAAAKERL